jgi:hypothetical protein
MQYVVHSIAQLLREAGYALPSAGQSASDEVAWIAVGPRHRVLHLDNLPDSLEK